MEIMLAILIGVGMFLLFNFLMGYRKGNIQIEFIEAIMTELEKQGKEVHYQGNRHFVIDGELYVFVERNVSMGGLPMQRTILKPIKK
jgi:hypothetical protein